MSQLVDSLELLPSVNLRKNWHENCSIKVQAGVCSRKRIFSGITIEKDFLGCVMSLQGAVIEPLFYFMFS
ncbi:MAG: hypothetical protein H6621_12625 [Halobacteriovoraceae bacterium]|nr:hypothetical protein [Halobacteriovoraceae bacterium]MCB9095905.1 hypothetical protein [Halobacteriovoraceae bacterium]